MASIVVHTPRILSSEYHTVPLSSFSILSPTFFFFGYVGSLLAVQAFLLLWQEGATLHCCMDSHHGGFCGCRVQPLGTRAQELWLVGSRA